MSRISLAEFQARVLAEFPELAEDFADHDGLPYLQMGSFSWLMEEAKGRGDWEVYARAARLADELWGNADEGLENALNVSLLEHLDFEGRCGPHAWSLLSPRLQRAWQDMAAYNEWLHSGAKGPPPGSADSA
ncbi:MAG TPA: hypothetical protein VFS20_09360 [Longimicrobium sp.]|nr:hypothetical protein [Longimicrobium sp.]